MSFFWGGAHPYLAAKTRLFLGDAVLKSARRKRSDKTDKLEEMIVTRNKYKR